MTPASSVFGLASVLVVGLFISPLLASRSRWPAPLVHLMMGMSLAAVWFLVPDSLETGAESYHPGTAAVDLLQTGLGLAIVFLAGRGLPFDHLKQRWRGLLNYSAAKFLPSLAVLPLVSALLWKDDIEGAIVLGVALCEISVAVSWSMLNSHGRIETEHGRDMLGTAFIVNSAVILSVLLLLQDIAVMTAAVAFIGGIASREWISLGEKNAQRWNRLADRSVVPLFFVFAGAKVDWSAVTLSYTWLPLLIAAVLVRAPIHQLSAPRMLGSSAMEGRYCDTLALGRLTFAVLILGLGASTGVVTAEMMSAGTVVVASLAALSSFGAHRLQLSRDSAHGS